jgi:hypothetical protein
MVINKKQFNQRIGRKVVGSSDNPFLLVLAIVILFFAGEWLFKKFSLRVPVFRWFRQLLIRLIVRPVQKFFRRYENVMWAIAISAFITWYLCTADNPFRGW